jgi:DNA-binding SARP family transcriptional activator
MGVAATEPLSTRYRPRRVLDFRILGPLEVVGDDGALRLGGPKQRATLAILLLNVNRVVSVDRLADDLYGGAAPVTAVTQVQRQISELRKLIGAAQAIETRPPGYVLRLAPEQLDLHRFERLAAEAGTSLENGDARVAAQLLRDALSLWRGQPFADLAYESFAQPVIERLDEIRLAALDQRIEADLGLGRHAELIGELEQLVAEHPLHERFSEQLMLALYRSGRQAEALNVYRRMRTRLVQELGLEPTPALQALEHAILSHDPSLDAAGRAPGLRDRGPGAAVLVVASDPERLDALLAIAEPLGLLPDRELIVARLLDDGRDLEPESETLTARCATLRATTRTSAFTTTDPPEDTVRLARANNVELVLLDAARDADAGLVSDELAALLERSPSDVGMLSAPSGEGEPGGGVFVPFAGGEHDWAALELGARLASATAAVLTLVGPKAHSSSHRRDASRLLADASLAVQRAAGIETRPVLVGPTGDALVAAVERAALVVVGISPRWRREGIGATRRALVRGARPPVLLVHRGPRPSGLAPRENRTRFTWTLEA